MQTVQVAIANEPYAAKLYWALAGNGSWNVLRVETPDPSLEGVLVVDQQAFDRVAPLLHHPERLVLITRNRPDLLERAWKAGIRSVVFETDPPETAALASLAVGLRPNSSTPV